MAGFSELFERQYPSLLRLKEARFLGERRRAVLGSEPDGSDDPQTDPVEIDEAIGTSADDRVGIALSGGGIRSATFCLGVFNALAEKGLLSRVDYLSTVSGGGYFGGFFGRLFTRKWITDADTRPLPPGDEALLDGKKTASERVTAVLANPRSWSMRFLRDSGRYLSPTSDGDFWLAIAMFLRNWVSMIAVLWILAFGAFATIAAVRALAWPLWPWLPLGAPPGEFWLLAQAQNHLWWSPWVALPFVFVMLVMVPTSLAYWLELKTWSNWRRVQQVHTHLSRLLAAVVTIAALYATFVGAPRWERMFDPPWLPRIVLVVMVATWIWWLVAMRLTRGKKSDGRPGRRTKYVARNRLTRWLTLTLQWTVGLALFAIIDTLGQSGYALLQHQDALPEGAGLAIGGSMLGLGAVAAFAQRIAIAFSRLPAGRAFRIPAALLATIAALALATLLLLSASYVTQAVAWRADEPSILTPVAIAPALVRDSLPLESVVDGRIRVLPGGLLYRRLRTDSVAPVASSADAVTAPWNVAECGPVTDRGSACSRPATLPLIVTAVGALLLAWMFGRIFGFFNLSGLHAFYSARLSRAYLGASNSERFTPTGARVGVPLRGDDIYWPNYKPWESGGPLHLVNQTVNETVSGRTQIEYRDRKGMIMAVGPAGLSVGSHDHALWAKPGSAASGGSGWRGKYLVPVTPLNTRSNKDEAFHSLGLPRVWPSRPDVLDLNEVGTDGISVDDLVQVLRKTYRLARPWRGRQEKADEQARAVIAWRNTTPRKRFVALHELLQVETSQGPALSPSQYRRLVGDAERGWAPRVGLPSLELDSLDDEELSRLLGPVLGFGDAGVFERLQHCLLPGAEPTGMETRVERCRLGRHVAISGAAFTTGIGYRTSLGTSMLAGLFNVRLGYWWTIDLTRETREKAGACTPRGWINRSLQVDRWFPVQTRLLDEFTARFFGPNAQRWYLSDGGHFENTATYELLRRRVPFIIVCDCGMDRDYKFKDISTLARQIRIDFGAEMEILDQEGLRKAGVHPEVRELLGTTEDFAIPVAGGEKEKKVPRRTHKIALLARVKFVPIDPNASDSVSCSYVLFIKPSVTGSEPPDILNYGSKKVDFPNESTLDQQFDEAQWESYRRLGAHIASQLFANYSVGESKWQPAHMGLSAKMKR